MKRIVILLLLASQCVLAQNNVALFHTPVSGEVKYNTKNPELTTASFELVGGMIVVQAQVNGETGSFILDTGSPGMVIDNEQHTTGEAVAMGVGGQLKVGKTALREFTFGNIHRQDLESYVLDISQLELTCGRDLMGLIGYDVLQQYELLFDYANQIIQIYPARDTKAYHKTNPAMTIPFQLQGHVPVIVVKIGGRKAYLGLDSGASVNLLEKEYLIKINDTVLSEVDREWMVGLDNVRQLVLAGNIHSSTIKGKSFPDMRYLFADMSTLQEHFGARLDGLLGYPFFKSHKVAINYKKKKVFIW